MAECLLIGGYDLSSENITNKYNSIIELYKEPENYVCSKYSRVCFELAQASAYMDVYGIKTKQIVWFREEKERMHEYLEKCNYACIITRYFENLYQFKDIISVIKKNKPSVKIIVGGGFLVNAMKKLTDREGEALLLTLGADYYIDKYECNMEAARIIAEDKKNGKKICLNDVFVKEKDKFAKIRGVGEQKNKHIPIDWIKYNEFALSFHSLRTTISCPFDCSFCGVKSRTERFTLIDDDIVEEEMKKLKKLNKVNIINFIDETINVPVDRFKKLLKRIAREGFSWCSFLRCDQVDEETVSLMKESGCMAVLLGVESGDDNMLKLMNKKTNTEKLAKGIRLLEQYEIMTFGYFIIGYPTETNETVYNTLDFINMSDLSFFKIHKWVCEHGTHVWDQRDKYGLVDKNGYWVHNTMDSSEADRKIDWVYKNAIKPGLQELDFALILQAIKAGADVNRVKSILSEK